MVRSSWLTRRLKPPLISSKLAGTAVLSKHKPLSTSFTLDCDTTATPKAPKLDADDVKGRLVTLEFERCWVIGTYVPNAGDGLKVNITLIFWGTHVDLGYIRIWIVKWPGKWRLRHTFASLMR
jgi:AP endonuclease-1